MTMTTADDKPVSRAGELQTETLIDQPKSRTDWTGMTADTSRKAIQTKREMKLSDNGRKARQAERQIKSADPDRKLEN